MIFTRARVFYPSNKTSSLPLTAISSWIPEEAPTEYSNEIKIISNGKRNGDNGKIENLHRPRPSFFFPPSSLHVTEESCTWCTSKRANRIPPPAPTLLVGSLSSDVFERPTTTGSEVLPFIICLDAVKFVLLASFTL